MPVREMRTKAKLRARVLFFQIPVFWDLTLPVLSYLPLPRPGTLFLLLLPSGCEGLMVFCRFPLSSSL